MSTAKLNPLAQEWVPSWHATEKSELQFELPNDPFDLSSEYHVSPEELEELEAVDDWVNMLADLEEEEQEHVISLALRYGDKRQVAAVQRGAINKPKKASISAGSSPRSQ